MAVKLKEDAAVGEVALLRKGRETAQAAKASPRLYEIGIVALTGLGAVDNKSIVYKRFSERKEKAKNRNAACRGAKLELQVFCPVVGIADWVGSVTNHVGDAVAAEQTERAPKRSPDTL